jgi:tellurite resistance protein
MSDDRSAGNELQITSASGRASSRISADQLAAVCRLQAYWQGRIGAQQRNGMPVIETSALDESAPLRDGQ